jgi:hypothetical protein
MSHYCYEANGTVEQDKDDCLYCLRNMRDNWREDCERWQRNTVFYENIVKEIGALFGDRARRCDDGTLSESVLALNVLPLVKEMFQDIQPFAEIALNYPQSMSVHYEAGGVAEHVLLQEQIDRLRLYYR